MLVLCHCHSTRIRARWLKLAPMSKLVSPAAEQKCTHPPLPIYEEEDDCGERPQGILEGFCISIFDFNEMLHSMQI